MVTIVQNAASLEQFRLMRRSLDDPGGWMLGIIVFFFFVIFIGVSNLHEQH